MNKNIEFLVKELNPKYDMQRHNIDDSFVGNMKDLSWFAINTVKSMV